MSSTLVCTPAPACRRGNGEHPSGLEGSCLRTLVAVLALLAAYPALAQTVIDGNTIKLNGTDLAPVGKFLRMRLSCDGRATGPPCH
jgi:hypothetical protein